MREGANVAHLAGWFHTGYGPLVTGDLQTEPGDLPAFRAENFRRSVRRVRLLIAALLGQNLLFWPTDDWLLGHLPEVQPALSEGRMVASLTGLAILLATFAPARMLTPAAWASAGAVCAVMAWTMGRIGGPGTTWFLYVYPFLFLALMAWATPLHRVLLSGFLAAVVAFFYFGLNPEHLDDPLAGSALANLVSVSVLAALIGLYLDHIRIRMFLFGREQGRQVDVLAAQVAAQTRHIQALLDHVEAARETERRELAAELHDEMGQVLTGMRCVLKVSRTRLGADCPPEIEQLALQLQYATGALRDVLTRLRPRVLDDLGLGAAVEWLVERSAEVVGLECDLALPEGAALESLSPGEANMVFRVVQESLTNVARHARASTVAVEMQMTAEAGLLLSVEDDGVGLEAREGREGFGILGMTERARAFGARLEVTPRRGGGTRVRLSLPRDPQPRLGLA